MQWAMLGSNQRPPPCKLGQRFPDRYCPVRKPRLYKRFLVFLAPLFSCSVLVRPAPVAAAKPRKVACTCRTSPSLDSGSYLSCASTVPLYRNRSHGYSSVSSPLDPSSDLRRRSFQRAVTNPNGTARVTVPFGPFTLAHELVRLTGANKIFRAIRLGLLPGLLGPILS